MNKWIAGAIMLFLMMSCLIFGFILGSTNEDLNAELYIEGYNQAVLELALIQLNESVIFVPYNDTVQKWDLKDVCGWEE